MPVLIVGAEKTLAALRPRLFTGRVSRVASQRAADAIRAANPGVDLEDLRPGTILSIPDLPEFTRRRPSLSLDDPTAQAGAGLLDAVGEALDALVAEAARRENENAKERTELTRLLDSRELAAARRADPDLSAELKAVRTALAEEGRGAEGRGPALERAQTQWREDLAALARLME